MARPAPNVGWNPTGPRTRSVGYGAGPPGGRVTPRQRLSCRGDAGVKRPRQTPQPTATIGSAISASSRLPGCDVFQATPPPPELPVDPNRSRIRSPRNGCKAVVASESGGNPARLSQNAAGPACEAGKAVVPNDETPQTPAPIPLLGELRTTAQVSRRSRIFRSEDPGVAVVGPAAPAHRPRPWPLVQQRPSRNSGSRPRLKFDTAAEQ